MPLVSGEGMTRRPTCGPVACRGTGIEARTIDITGLSTRSTIGIRFSAVHSLRRAASASRTCGRCAVVPAGRSLTPTPYSTLSKRQAELRKKKINSTVSRVDRPRSLRDDTKWRWPE